MKVIEQIKKSVKVVGMLGIIWGLTSFAVAAPEASAAQINKASNSGNSSGIVVSYGKLEVYAIDSTTGKTIGGATVAVYDLNGQGVVKGYTDSTGQFRSYVPEGAYKMIVSASSYNEYGQYVKIVSGQTTSLKAELQSTTVSPSSPSVTK